MKFTKMVFLIFLVITLLFVGYSSRVCADEVIELEFPSWTAIQASGFYHWFTDLIETFESKHPNVKIDYYSTPSAGENTTILQRRFAAGDPPDIVHLATRNVIPFMQRGWFAPLDEELENTGFPEEWTPLQSMLEEDGNNYGVLLLGIAYNFYYNEKHFEEAGVKVPTNLEEFVAAAKELTVDLSGDGEPDRFGVAMASDGEVATYLEGARFVIGQGGHFSSNGELALDSPEVKKGFEVYRELLKANATPMGMDDNQRRSAFLDGRASMIFDGPWFRGIIEDQAGDDFKSNIKITSLPFEVITGGVSNSLHIPANISNEKKKLVVEFLKMVVEPYWQVKFMESVGSPTPRNMAIPDKVLEKIPELTLFAEDAAKAVNYMPPGFEENYGLMADLIGDALLETYSSEREIDEILNDLEKEIKERINQ